MLFTGSVQRRRNVNLGGKSTSGFSRQSVLQRSKLEREKRELDRKREHAAIVLQSRWRSILCLRRAAQELIGEQGGSNERVLRRFAFVSRVTKVTNIEELTKIFHILESEVDGISNLLLRNVLSAVEQFVTDESLLPVVADFDAALAAFSSEKAAEIIFTKADTFNLWSRVQPLVPYHPALVLTKLFTLDDLFSKLDWKTLNFNAEQPDIYQRLTELSEDEILTALKNLIFFAKMRQHNAQIINAGYALVAAYSDKIAREPDYNSDDEQGEAFGELSKILDPLYERDVVAIMLSFITESEHFDDVVFKTLALLTKLIELQPSKSSQIIMALILHSKPVAHILWAHCKMLSMENLAARQAVDNRTAFAEDYVKQKDHLPVLELLLKMQNFWLMVADDDEFLKNDRQGLNIDETREFITFLKNFTYNALIYDSKLRTLSSEEYSYILRLRKASVIVLRQVYLRDMRRNFMQKRFWLSEYKIPRDDMRVIKYQEPHADELPAEALIADAPFSLSFDTRVSIFSRRIYVNRDDDYFESRALVTIGRENPFMDAYSAFQLKKISLHKFSVQFMDITGSYEAGVDGGGLTKEMLNAVSAEGFHPDYGLFVETENHLLYPNPDIVKISNAKERKDKLNKIAFLGRIIGKSLVEGILLDYEFAPFFLQKCQGSRLRNSFDDLFWLDSELYNSLVRVLRYDGDVQEAMALNFEFDDTELVPGGSQIPVTNANRLNYIHAVANYKLNTVLGPQSNAFFAGVAEFVEPKLLGMFSAPELQTLISGESGPVDLEDFRKHVKLQRYSYADQTIKDFFDVLAEFDGKQWSQLLKFVTSVPKPPLGGFGSLNPSICISSAGHDTDRLPSASTCMNLLKLPEYQDKQALRKKLHLAISAETGFDFS